jgi:Fe-S cluster assembly scaffold protein SufB
MALKAFRIWQEMELPEWAKLQIPHIDYQDAYYYAEPKQKKTIGSLDELDPEILRVYEKLGIPIEEQKVLAGVEGARKIAVDAVFDSVSVATTFRKELEEAGVIFRSISRSDPRISRAGEEVAGQGRAPARQFLLGAELARSSPTAPSSTFPRACAARWSSAPISASMPRIPASSSAR